MDTQHIDAIEAVGRRFVRYLETGAAPDEVFAPDVFLDFTPPLWRLQARGVADAHALRMRGHPGAGQVPRWTLQATAEGFVMEAEERWTDAKGDWYCREAFIARVQGGRIARLAVYCTGDWDAERQRVHCAQVPLLEP